MLRKSSKEIRLEEVKSQAASSSSSQRPITVETNGGNGGGSSLQPIRESDVEVVVENKPNSVRSSSISLLHGALNKATSILKKNKDASIFENSKIDEDDQIGITNRGFDEDER